MKLSHALKMCLNWKVLTVIIAVIVVLFVIAPKWAIFAPYLLILVCPLSMILMMAGMKHTDSKSKNEEEDK